MIAIWCIIYILQGWRSVNQEISNHTQQRHTSTQFAKMRSTTIVYWCPVRQEQLLWLSHILQAILQATLQAILRP